jgi:hypothetical protein
VAAFRYSWLVSLQSRLSDLRTKIQDTVETARSHSLVQSAHGRSAPLAENADEPPVVARLMVEIRSDGTRTIARGALEDIGSGERVAIEAKGSSPAQLAASLARTLFATPFLAKAAVRAVLDGRRGKGADGG